MSYKIFACDLDGTLLDDNSNVSKDNFDAIEQMTKDGIEFALCTGRTFYEIPQSLRDFQSIRYIIYSDGSVIYDKKKNKNVYEHYIDMQTLIRLYNLLSSYDTMIEFYENKEPKTDKSKLNINSYRSERFLKSSIALTFTDPSFRISVFNSWIRLRISAGSVRLSSRISSA